MSQLHKEHTHLNLSVWCWLCKDKVYLSESTLTRQTQSLLVGIKPYSSWNQSLLVRLFTRQTQSFCENRTLWTRERNSRANIVTIICSDFECRCFKINRKCCSWTQKQVLMIWECVVDSHTLDRRAHDCSMCPLSCLWILEQSFDDWRWEFKPLALVGNCACCRCIWSCNANRAICIWKPPWCCHLTSCR